VPLAAGRPRHTRSARPAGKALAGADFLVFGFVFRFSVFSVFSFSGFCFFGFQFFRFSVLEFQFSVRQHFGKIALIFK
jgi:hypothetical protein